jgi:hypothetical protein
MAHWIIVSTMLAVAGGAPLCAAAQEPLLLSPSPNAECQRRTLGSPQILAIGCRDRRE